MRMIRDDRFVICFVVSFPITFVDPIGHSVINGVWHAGVRYSNNAASLGEHLVIDIVLVNVNQGVPRRRPLVQGYAVAICDFRVLSR